MSDGKGQQYRAVAIDIVRFGGRRAAACLALILLGSLLEGIGLALLIPILAVLTDASRQGALGLDRLLANVGLQSGVATAGLLIGTFVALIGLRALVITARDRKLQQLQLGYAEAARLRLIEAIGSAEWQDLAALRHARITHAIGIDVARVGTAAQFLLLGTSAFATLLVQSALALWVAPAFAAVAIALFGTIALFMLPVLRRVGRLGAALSAQYMEMFDSVGQLLGGAKLAVAQNMRQRFIESYTGFTRGLTDQQLAFARQHSLTSVATTSITALAGAALLLVGLAMELGPVTILASLAIFMRMAGPASMLQTSAVQFANAAPAHAALQAVTADLGRLADRTSEAAEPLPAEPSPIIADAITFAHPPGDAGVRDVTVTIEPGTMIGITGDSGAGKTTFVDLVAGLYVPHSGTIRIGDRTLSPANVAAWRARIAYVAQDGFLFNDTLRRNLQWGAEADDDVIWAALGHAGALEVVRAMPHGLDTVVSERGSRLSGGERQRIAIARALLRGADLLILDEATNAIDTGTEHAILTRLRSLDPRPTTLIVTHHAPVLALCDRVLTFSAGRLTNAG